MFGLKHPFDNDYKIPALSADNLMDYADGTHLAKWQWDLIHDPGIILRVFERDKDAEINKSDLLKLLSSIRNANINRKQELDIDFEKLSIRGSEEDVNIGGKLTHIYVHYGTMTESYVSHPRIKINPSDKNVSVFEGKLYNHKYNKLELQIDAITLTVFDYDLQDSVQIILDSIPLSIVQVPETYLVYCFPTIDRFTDDIITDINVPKPNGMFYIFVLEKEKAIFEEYIYTRQLLEEAVIIDIPWVSQYDSIVKDIQGNYLSCIWKSSGANTCCYTVCWYMCHQYTGKHDMIYMDIAHLKNDTVYNSGLVADGNFEQNIQTLSALLASKTPVMIGVNRSERKKLGNRSNPATHHWLVGMGIGKDPITGNAVIYFHEVGTTNKSTGDGRFQNNKLEIDMVNKYVTGKNPYSKEDEKYTVTAIRY